MLIREKWQFCWNVLITPKSMASIDSAGIGPKGRISVGRKVAYPVASLITWLELRSKQAPGACMTAHNKMASAEQIVRLGVANIIQNYHNNFLHKLQRLHAISFLPFIVSGVAWLIIILVCLRMTI